MVDFYLKYGGNHYSQNNEDGIVTEIFNRIGITPALVCEWGINDGKFCSNTRHWVEQGARGVWIEYDEHLYQQAKLNSEELNVDLYNCAIDQYNVNDFVPIGCDLVSLDTDGSNDLYTWKAMKAQPPVVIIEINSSYLPMEDRVEEGANYSAMVKLGASLGYFIVAHTGNCVFVDAKYRKLFPDILGDGLSNWEQYFLTDWLGT